MVPPRFEDLHARSQGCYIQPSQNNAKHRFLRGLAIWYPPKKTHGFNQIGQPNFMQALRNASQCVVT